MTLELLFAQAQQGRSFLMMLLAGAAAALLIHLTGALHRISRMAGLAGDALCALLVSLVVSQAAMWSGGLRLYGLLGLCIGLTLYLCGAAPLLHMAAGLVQKSFPRRKE